MKHTITCISFEPFEKNTLRGFSVIRINELRLIIHDVPLHEKGGAGWAQSPSKPWLRDGSLATDNTRKVQYSPILEFERRETRDAFSAAVWRAVREFMPEMVVS